MVLGFANIFFMPAIVYVVAGQVVDKGLKRLAMGMSIRSICRVHGCLLPAFAFIHSLVNAHILHPLHVVALAVSTC